MAKDSTGITIRERNQLSVVECEDPHGNTPLSEASSGGNVDTIRLLVERGADPNTQGQFQRTPLYRAAYAGHLDACQALLQYGADPRIYADDGQMPEHVTCFYLYSSPFYFTPIPSALYHTAGNRVDISLISLRFYRRVVLLKNGLISVKTR